MTVSEKDIAAFADGELLPQDRDRVAAAIAADPSLARKVEQHHALRALLSAHFAPVLEQDVPDRLASMLVVPEAEVKVVDIAAARGRRIGTASWPRWGWIAGPALAASLAWAIIVPRGEQPGGGFIEGELAQTLETQLAGNSAEDADTRILLSFREVGGRYCRAYASDTADGIACREQEGWVQVDRFTGEATESGEFRQAGASRAALFARVQDMADGPALDLAAERSLRATGWIDN